MKDSYKLITIPLKIKQASQVCLTFYLQVEKKLCKIPTIISAPTHIRINSLGQILISLLTKIKTTTKVFKTFPKLVGNHRLTILQNFKVNFKKYLILSIIIDTLREDMPYTSLLGDYLKKNGMNLGA